MLERLVQLHRAGQLAEAEAGYRQWLDEHPDHAEAMYLLGIVQGQRGDLHGALELIGKAGGLAPDNAMYRHTMGEILLSAGQLDAAQAAYEQAQSLDPELAIAHGGLGQIALLRGDADAAERHFKLALRADGNDVQALAGLGALAQRRGDPQRALQLLTQAAQLAPDDPLIQMRYARIALDQGILDLTAKALDKALAVHPDYAEAQLLRADVHVRQRELAQAQAICDALLARGEHLAEARARLGDVARARGHHDDAIAHYDAALRLQLDLHIAASGRAKSLAACGRAAQAIDDLRGYIEHHPDDMRTQALLASLLTQAGRHAEALPAWTRIEARWPNEVDLKAQHALALDRAGRGTEAMALAEAAAESSRPALALLRARGALLAGDPAAAVQRLQRVDARKLVDKSPLLVRRQQRLLGLAFDALEQWSDAVDALMQAQRATHETLPALPTLDDDATARLQQLAAEPRLGQHFGAAPVFLCGLPGSGAGQVASLLADQPGWFVRGERFRSTPDFVTAPCDAQLTEPLDQAALTSLARRYRRPLERAGVAANTRVVDWLPLLDARVAPALKRALPGARLVVVHRDPHDTLLDWLGFGWAQGFSMPDPLTGARWLRGAARHLAAAAAILPSFFVDPDALLAPGDAGPRMRLGVFLGVADLEAGALARGARRGRSGLPVSFPPGHASHYREALSEAFAILDDIHAPG